MEPFPFPGIFLAIIFYPNFNRLLGTISYIIILTTYSRLPNVAYNIHNNYENIDQELASYLI